MALAPTSAYTILPLEGIRDFVFYPTSLELLVGILVVVPLKEMKMNETENDPRSERVIPHADVSAKTSAPSFVDRGRVPMKVCGEADAALEVQGDILQSLETSRGQLEKVYYLIFGETLASPEPESRCNLSEIDGIIPRFRASANRNVGQAYVVSGALESILNRLSDDQ